MGSNIQAEPFAVELSAAFRPLTAESSRAFGVLAGKQLFVGRKKLFLCKEWDPENAVAPFSLL